MSPRKSLILTLIILSLTAGLGWAQTSSGALRGRVTYLGKGVAGVDVTVTSGALQGQRSVATTGSGDYRLPGLPSGHYEVVFDLKGYHQLRQEVRISPAQVQVLDAVLVEAHVSEEIDVTDRPETVSMTQSGAETVDHRVLAQLSPDRSLEAAVSLAAGTANTGPRGQASISGAHSFENLYTMNGIVLNETIRQQPAALFVEDAIQDTTVLTSGVSAEFGRFSGGVVHMVTKIGGNSFSGSFRLSLDNDDWTASTPLTTEKVDRINQSYEGTLGGYLKKDRLWFFLAAGDRTLDRSRQTHVTGMPYTQRFDDTRVEAKMTALLGRSHRLTATYGNRDWPYTNGDFGGFPSMDLDSIDPLYELENEGLALHYSGILGPNLFLEAQVSRQEYKVKDVGGDDPSLDGGSTIVDYLENGSFHAPWFCGRPCRDEERDNENYLAKLSYFLDTQGLGTHDLLLGYDSFSNRVLYDNHLSASDYQIWTLFPHDFSSGAPLLRMIPGASLVVYTGLVEPSRRTDFRTHSFYVNDVWRVGRSVTLNLGLRYDANDGRDASGTRVVDDSRFSPRLGVSWDIQGDGQWIVNGSAGRYVSAMMYSVANQGTGAGRPVNLGYLYLGPAVLASEVGGNGPALQEVFDWFFNVYGGLENTDGLFLADIPGLTDQIGESLGSPYVDELSVGFAARLGSLGVVRADYVHREYRDFYALSNAPGQWVESPLGGFLDLGIVGNEDELLERVYDGLLTRFQLRPGTSWTLGGSWTWSHARGNFDGETAGGSAFDGDVGEYQEYKDPSWYAPRGDLVVDQRHKVRLWAILDALATARHHIKVSLFQSYLSGSPYSAVGIIDNSLGLEYVGNPGYITPPRLLDYYFSPRGQYRTASVTSTDLGFTYTFLPSSRFSRMEFFVQGHVLNLFDEQAVVAVDRTVLTSESDPTLEPFNPLTEAPQEGVHWRKGPSFGRPTREEHYQLPRTLRLSLGIRF